MTKLSDFRKHNKMQPHPKRYARLNLIQSHKCHFVLTIDGIEKDFKLEDEIIFQKHSQEDIGAYTETTLSTGEILRVWIQFWNERVFLSDVDIEAKDGTIRTFEINDEKDDIEILYYNFRTDWYKLDPKDDVEYRECRLYFEQAYLNKLYSTKSKSNELVTISIKK